MSAIQKRLIKELYNGTKLSVKNMYLVRCSNISREIRRQIEIPFDLELHRDTISWKDEFSSGTYFEYSVKPEDRKVFEKLFHEYCVKDIEVIV